MNKNWFENVLSGNGNSRHLELAADLLENQQDLQDIDRMLYELGTQLNRQDLNAETASMVQAFGGYINTNVFDRILRGRGNAFRIVSPLSDRVIEIEGWGKLHLHVSCLQTDMSVIIAYKTFSISVRLDKIQQAMAYGSTETQELMTRILAVQREHLFQISQKLIEFFGSQTIDMLMEPVNE
jgi:hypothetical protein